MSRRPDVDVVRAVALVSMYVAHVAPSSGPGNVLHLSEYLTMPLFALLIGVGAQLGLRRRISRGPFAWWRSMLVRAAVLVAVGLALEKAGAQVMIVLVHLGVLLVVAGLLSLAPTVVVAVVGVAALVIAPALTAHVLEHGPLLGTSSWAMELESLLWSGYAYRVTTMIVYAALGILLARAWLTGGRLSPGRSVRVSAWGTGALVLAAALIAGDRSGRIEVSVYSGTHLETLLNALLAMGVFGLCLVFVSLLPNLLVRPVAAMGAMTLTLYALQILWLAFDVRVLNPGVPDDSWRNLMILTGGSLLFVLAWRLVVRREPWRRGPLEGLTATLSR